MKLKFSKEFWENLEKILKNNSSFASKIETIIYNFKKFGLWIENYQIYNLKKLNKLFFRLKIIPYRIIIKKENNFLVFDNIFQRKGKSDYKQYKK